MFLWRDCRTRGGHSRDGATSDTVIEALSAAPLASRLGYTLRYRRYRGDDHRRGGGGVQGVAGPAGQRTLADCPWVSSLRIFESNWGTSWADARGRVCDSHLQSVSEGRRDAPATSAPSRRYAGRPLHGHVCPRRREPSTVAYRL